ncbi:MAG: YceG family protein, partial [Clostridium sp.]
MFRKKFERSNGYLDFKPYFYRYIGVEDTSNYDDVLKTLKEKLDLYKDKHIVFDGSIPMIGEMELIQH